MVFQRIAHDMHGAVKQRRLRTKGCCRRGRFRHCSSANVRNRRARRRRGCGRGSSFGGHGHDWRRRRAWAKRRWSLSWQTRQVLGRDWLAAFHFLGRAAGKATNCSAGGRVRHFLVAGKPLGHDRHARVAAVEAVSELGQIPVDQAGKLASCAIHGAAGTHCALGRDVLGQLSAVLQQPFPQVLQRPVQDRNLGLDGRGKPVRRDARFHSASLGQVAKATDHRTFSHGRRERLGQGRFQRMFQDVQRPAQQALLDATAHLAAFFGRTRFCLLVRLSGHFHARQDRLGHKPRQRHGHVAQVLRRIVRDAGCRLRRGRTLPARRQSGDHLHNIRRRRQRRHLGHHALAFGLGRSLAPQHRLR